MDNLTQEEKKSIIIKVVVSIALLIAMIIIGLVLTFGSNLTSRLKGEAISANPDALATCDNLIAENYGYIKFNDTDSAKEMLPVTLTFTDRKTGDIYTKEITDKDFNMNSWEIEARIPVGNYDIKITKPGYLYTLYEDVTINSNSNYYLNITNMLTGDITGDGIENIGRWYKKGILYTGEFIIDQDNVVLTYDNKNAMLTYHKSEYFKKEGTFSWYSSNSNVASVDQNGEVTAKKVGTAKISYGGSNYVTVTVKEEGSIIIEDKITMDGITSKQLSWSYSDSTFQNSPATFSSSNTSVVTVDEKGVLKSYKAGTAIITVKAGFNTTAKITVTVNDVVAKDFEVSYEDDNTESEDGLTINGYKHKQLTIKSSPENATIYDYEYEIVDEKEKLDDTYATVTTDGVITSKKSGTTYVKVTLTSNTEEESNSNTKEKSKIIPINITYVQTKAIAIDTEFHDPIENEIYSKYSDENVLSFDGAELKNIEIKYYPSNGLDREIVATSADDSGNSTKILSVVSSGDGHINARSAYPGNATINFSIDREKGEQFTGKINVAVTDVPITGAKLNAIGGTDFGSGTLKQLTMDAVPSNHTLNYSIGFIEKATSSNTSFATIGSSSIGVSSVVNVWRKIGKTGSTRICAYTTKNYSACTTLYKN